MRSTCKEKTETMSNRVAVSTIDKLRWLSLETNMRPGAIIDALVGQAEPTHLPTVRLRAAGGTGDGSEWA